MVRYWLRWIALSLIVHAGLAALVGRRIVVSQLPPERIVVSLQPATIARRAAALPIPSPPASTPAPRPATPAPTSATQSIARTPQLSHTPHPSGTTEPVVTRAASTHAPPVTAAPATPAVARVPVAPTSATAAPPAATAAPQASPVPTVGATAASHQVATAPKAPAANEWFSSLTNRIASFKRYPVVARNRDEQGVTYVNVTLDRSGKVLDASVATSSGYDVLDQEAVDMVQRASPLPAPPAAVAPNQSRVTIVVPIAFALQ